MQTFQYFSGLAVFVHLGVSSVLYACAMLDMHICADVCESQRRSIFLNHFSFSPFTYSFVLDRVSH